MSNYIHGQTKNVVYSLFPNEYYYHIDYELANKQQKCQICNIEDKKYMLFYLSKVEKYKWDTFPCCSETCFTLWLLANL